jgi:hypothetical protein
LIVMSLFWAIFWIGSILAALIAFAVIAMRENSRTRTAASLRHSPNMAVSEPEGMPADSMENLDSFPSENFDFDDGTMKS